MPFFRSSALIATAYLVLSARALPRPNPEATYQVVNVGGPSSAAPVETIYSTITESSTPSTVTEPPITVTVTPSTSAAKTRSKILTAMSDQPAYSHSSGSPPLPTLNTAPAPSPTTATETTTVYNTVPVAPYAAESTPSTTSSKASSSLKGAFTQGGIWNHTITAIHGPASSGTGVVMYTAVPTGSTRAKRWVAFAATGTGAYLAGRAAPTGTGAYLAGRAAPTGTGAYLAGRAAPTGYTGHSAQGWNATNNYYWSSNDRLA